MTTKKSTSWQDETKKNTLHLAIWTALWLITFAISKQEFEFFGEQKLLVSFISISVNLIVGIGMILANRKHLQSLDEMQQKIQLSAMALSLGVGLIISLTYSNLFLANIAPFEGTLSHLIILMSLTYLFGVKAGYRKYG